MRIISGRYLDQVSNDEKMMSHTDPEYREIERYGAFQPGMEIYYPG
jgi:hypothetical protein